MRVVVTTPRKHNATIESKNFTIDEYHGARTLREIKKVEMDNSQKSTSSLFQVYLRLRPPPTSNSLYPTLPSGERFLTVEPPREDGEDAAPTHITLNPPNDNRRRAVEKFAFTKVFEENASQLDVFQETGLIQLVEGVLGPQGGEGRDGLLATLGVTGSGKSHTILGTRNQRGLTQLALDLLYRSVSSNLLDPQTNTSLHATVAAADASEAQVLAGHSFLDSLFGDPNAPSRANSRAPTPMRGESIPPPTPRRIGLTRPSCLPNFPDISSFAVPTDANCEYAIVISMYEVYNDRIFDLLTPATRIGATKEFRRRALLFKPTEQSPDRKVVAGLRKIICGNMREALMVLEAGLHERRVAGTGSNSVSSRSHGFFVVEVKKRRRGRIAAPWSGSTLTIVDLAGSERARDAKTQGATLAEAGKINESLMYLGQCLQMQSDLGNHTKANLVPYRQCKLTELLFSNSFPSTNATTSSSHHHRNPQKAIMIVTADPLGDFNATSQILRYSALAREITIPRIPSVTSQILAATATSTSIGSQTYFSAHGGSGPHRNRTPTDTERETMELAALEIARMSEEIDALRSELLAETQRRMEAESHLLSFEERLNEQLYEQLYEQEMDVREECFREMEGRMALEMAKWRARWEAELDSRDEHVDRKIEILERCLNEEVGKEGSGWTTGGMEDDDKENYVPHEQVEELMDENERLRRQVAQLQRELEGNRSPSKKRSILGESRLVSSNQSFGGDDVEEEMQRLRLSGPEGKSPVKKMKKLAARKWEIVDEGEYF